MSTTLDTDLAAPAAAMPPGEDGGIKKRQILRAARRLFFHKPYDGVSMRAIAAQAKIAEATLHLYFPSKEALFSALVVEELAATAVEIWRLTTEGADTEAVLLEVARNYVGLFGASHAIEVHRSLIHVCARFPHLGEFFYEHGARVLLERLSAFIAARHKAGELEIPDAELAAEQFLSLIHGTLHLREVLSVSPVSAGEIDRVITGGVRLFLAGHRP